MRCFTPSTTDLAGSGLRGVRDFRRQPDLSPDQRARISARLRRAQGIETSWAGCRMRATNRLAAFAKAMSWQLTIASNGLWSGFDSQHAFACLDAARAVCRPACFEHTHVDHRLGGYWN
jgi:hypothetical protein